MMSEQRTQWNAIAAVVLVALGAAGGMVVQRMWTSAPPSSSVSPDRSASTTTAGAAPADAAPGAVQLSPDMVTRVGIRTATVRAGGADSSWRAPGTVDANAYRQTVVTPVAGGRVTSVAADLGQVVTEGQSLAEIYSPELADAERAYLTSRTDLALAAERKQRADKLGAIGAVSQQEVDDARAEWTRQTNAVEGARSRLRLLGLSTESINALVSANDITATIHVPAPSSGTIVKRGVNRGQNVDAKSELFTIADLSSVWVIADVYERDMARVAIGTEARVTSAALAGRTWTGRVVYLDPQVSTDTRTLKARIEVANTGIFLKPGMLVDVEMRGSAKASLVMPRAAAQQTGGQTLVFVADGTPGHYVAREVHLGAVSGDDVAVVDGLASGDVVVTDGAFSLKAEWERIGGRVVAMAAPQRVALRVTESGFSPERVAVTAGTPIQLVVTRVTDKTCGTEIVIGEKGPRAKLPLNTPVTVMLPAMPRGELAFACGMAMRHGAIVAR